MHHQVAGTEEGTAAPSAVGQQRRLGRWLLLSMGFMLAFVLSEIMIAGNSSVVTHANSLAGSAVQAVTLKQEQKNTGKRFAYVFYVTRDMYGCSALNLMDNLVNVVNMDTSRIDLVVLHSNHLSQRMRNRMQAAVPVKFIEVPTIHADVPGDSNWGESLTKLLTFKEWGYDRVVYMDADGVPNQNLDHLFDLPRARLYAPVAYWIHPQPFFTSVLMVIEPSNAVFDSMITWARETGGAAGYDMDILNSYFRDSVKMLPGEYSVLSGHLRGAADAPSAMNSTVTELRQRAQFIHYSCLPDGPFCKPWAEDSRREIPGMKGKGNEDFFVALFEAFWKTEKKC